MAAASAWSVEQLQRWVLDASGLDAGLAAELAAQLLAEEIDGAALLIYSRDDLKADLGLPGGKVTKLWKAIAPLREGGEGAAEEGVPGGKAAPAEQVPPPAAAAKVPKQLAVLVDHLPRLDAGCWRSVVAAAGGEGAAVTAVDAALATELQGCGVGDGAAQLKVVQQCAFLLKQFAKAGVSTEEVQSRLKPMGFSDAQVYALLGLAPDSPLPSPVTTPRSASGTPRSLALGSSDDELDEDEDEEEEDDDDEFYGSPTSQSRWVQAKLTSVKGAELKTLLQAVAQHMLGMALQDEELDSVEEACTIAKIALRHTSALMKVLTRSILAAAAEGDGDETAALEVSYPMGEGHAALIASAAKWYRKQLKKKQATEAKQAKAERDERHKEAAAAAASAGEVGILY